MNTGAHHEDWSRPRPFNAPGNRALGIVLAVVFALLAARSLLTHGHRAGPYAAVAVILVVVAVAAPRLLGPVNRLWTPVASLLQRIVSNLVLGILFFLVVVPAAYVARRAGWDPLARRRDQRRPSFWTVRHADPSDSMRHEY